MSDGCRGVIRLLGFTALLLQLAQTPAAGDPPSVEASVGFGGLYRSGSWLPATLSLENQDLDWQGRLVVSTPDAVLTKQVTLPAPSKKTYYLEVPTTGRLLDLDVRLHGAEGELAWKVPLEPVGTGSAFFVSVEDDSSTGSLLRPDDPPGEDRWARIRPEELPEGWRGLAGVDAVILDASSAGLLRPSQRQALADWLLLGGEVVLQATDPQRLGPVLLRWGLIPNGLEEPAFEQTRRYRRGEGALVLTASSDLEAAIEALRESLPRQRRVGAPASTAHPGDRIPVDKTALPGPMGTLTFFLTGYLGCVLLVLWRSTSPPSAMTMTLGLAAAVVIFTLGSCSIDRVVHGGRMVGRSSTVVRVFPQERESYVTTVARFRSPGESAIRVRARGRASFVTAEVGKGEPGVQIEVGDQGWQSVPAQLWQQRLVAAGGFAETGLGIEKRNGEPILVRNDSAFDLLDCRLLEAGSEQVAVDLPAGTAVRYAELARPGLEEPRIERRGHRLLMEQYLAGRRRIEPGDRDRHLVCLAAGEMGILESEPEWHPVEGATLVIFQLAAGAHPAALARTRP